MKKAFVSGATGFLGLNLIGELKKAGWDITAMHLPGDDLRYLSRLKVRAVEGDILDYGSLVRAVPERCDAVFHVAGDTSMWNRNNARQYRINVTGTMNMAGAALGKKAGRFIHTSSVSAYGYHPGDVISEKTGSNALKCGMNYNLTKYLAEIEVKKAAARGLDAVILNPCNIIGPYDRVNWSQVIKAVHHGRLQGIPPGSGTFAHVRDVARAHIAAAERGRSGENYILGGVEARFKEVFNTIEVMLGKEVSGRIISKPKLLLAMYLFRVKSLFDGREPAVTPAKYRRLVGRLACDDSRAVRELGFSTVSLKEMFADSYEWLTREGLLNEQAPLRAGNK